MKKKPNPESIDADNPEWTEETSARAMPFSSLSVALRTKLRGRPKADVTKQAVKLRLDPDVLAVLRATGPGWQTRINTILRERFAL